MSREILSGFIDEAITKLPEQVVVQKISAEFGDKYVDDFVKNLKGDLLTEIQPQNIPAPPANACPLNLEFSRQTEKTEINGVAATIYRAEKKTNVSGDNNLVNIVVPCRNSTNLISDSFELLMSEMAKSKKTEFNVAFQVNNTKDDTTQKILSLIDSFSEHIPNGNLYLVETPQKDVLSLPGSLNIGYTFLNKMVVRRTGDSKTFFSFWDDELKPIIPTALSLFESNILQLTSSAVNKAVSGYMVDTRNDVSRWHELCKGFSSDLRFIHSKPYLHGGAGTILKFSDYPESGIKMGGIADTDLSEHLLGHVDVKTLSTLSSDNWPVRTNSDAPVYHPIKENILNWTTKYLMYQIAWRNTFQSISNTSPETSSLWEQRINENRTIFHNKLKPYLESLPVPKIIERAFMRSYYLVIKNTKNILDVYNSLKSFRSRSFEMK